MEIDVLKKQMLNLVNIELCDGGVYTIKTQASLPNGLPINLYLKKGKIWHFTDGKFLYEYLDENFDLKATDVKKCVKNILERHHFYVKGSEIVADIINESVIGDRFFEFIMCIGELVNMDIFFD